MSQLFLALIVLAAAVVAVRRLVGIRRGRWTATLIAILVAEAAAVEIVRSIYGPIREAPGRVWIGVYALLVIFSALGVMLLEILLRHGADRRPRRLPHPIRGARDGARRIVRYVEVLTIWIHRGLIHADHDGDISGSRLGRSLRRSFEDAGGLFVKLGQAMAQQPQLVSAAVANELAALQEAAAPADLQAARAVIAADIGPPEEIFAQFDEIPLGSASIAQTYAARLNDGRQVVVKVQRPGIADLVERDLDILRRLAGRFDRRTTWARAIGLKELVRGFAERTHEELDFRVEAYNEAYAARSVHDGDVVVPPVIEGFSTRRVLVEERAPGQSVSSEDAFAGMDAERRRSLADALLSRSELKDAGFGVDVKQQESSKPKGTVIAQSPKGGTSAKPHRSVTLVVAKPPGPSCDPNYSDCLKPNALDYDCAGGSGDGPLYTGRVDVLGVDHYGLDSDGDGVGCE